MYDFQDMVTESRLPGYHHCSCLYLTNLLTDVSTGAGSPAAPYKRGDPDLSTRGCTKSLPTPIQPIPTEQMRSDDGPSPMDSQALPLQYLHVTHLIDQPFTAIDNSKNKTRQHQRPYSSSANTTETSSSESSVGDRARQTNSLNVQEKLTRSSPIVSAANSREILAMAMGERLTEQFTLRNLKNKNGSASRKATSLSDSDVGLDLISFHEDRDCLPEKNEELLVSLPDHSGTRNPLRAKGRSKKSFSCRTDNSNYNTICDNFLEDVQVERVSHVEPKSTVQPIPDVKATSSFNHEVFLLDVLDFIAEALADVKSWIHEIPVECRKRIGQCDAFLSYLSAKFYKDRDILVGSELFSFIFWFILKDYSSLDEYNLDLLDKALTECKEKSWAADWSRLPILQVVQDLPPSINCQNKACLTRSVASSSTCSEYEFSVLVPPKIVPKLKPSGTTLSKKVVIQSMKSCSSNLLDQDANFVVPTVVHSLSIDSLSGALAKTQLRKSTSYVCNPEEDDGTGGSGCKLPSAENMNFLLSRTIPVRPSPSKASRAAAAGLKPSTPEPDSQSRTCLSDAGEIIHKIGKRNLRRMLDYALTDFFTQNPSLTCCLVSVDGPLLVHEALFGAQCTNWTNVRWTGQKRVGNSGNLLIIDLQPESVASAGLWTVVEYIYTGIFTVTANNVFESQRAANYFGISVITDACLRLLNCLTNPKMVCYTIESLRRLHKEAHPLWTLALGKLVVCFDECRSDKIMVRWPLEVILPILEQPELNTTDEVNVYNLAVRWVEADFPRRRILVPQIMNTIRFASMTGDILLAISSHARILDGHPNLRQEIADLHLKIRMEDSGFEIPPEMDWSIPRRTRRVPNAAKAYLQSGRDLNVLMLYFCLREFPTTKEKSADVSIELLHRYLSVCSKFLLITEDGKFAGQWIYYGYSKQEMRDMAEQRKKLLRGGDPCKQSAVDMDVEQVANIHRQQFGFFDEEEEGRFDSAFGSLKDLEPGTKISSIVSLLQPDYDRATAAPPFASPSQDFTTQQSTVTSVIPNPSACQLATVPDLIGKVTRHLEELRKTSSDPNSHAHIPADLHRGKTTLSLSPLRKVVSAVPRLAAPQFSFQKTTSPTGQKKTVLPEGGAVIPSESMTSLTFDGENQSHDFKHDNTHQQKKWYVELAEKMNVFVTGDEAGMAGRHPNPTVSSLCLPSELDYFA